MRSIAIVLVLCSCRAAPENLDKVFARALEGNEKAALDELKNVDSDWLVAEAQEQRKCLEQTFIEHKPPPLAIADPFVVAVTNVYHDYWTRVLLGELSPRAAEASLFEHLKALVPGATLPDVIDVLGSALQKRGYYSQLGVVLPFHDLILWTKQEEKRFPVRLPGGQNEVKVFVLRDAVVRGWGDFATCGGNAVGGWAKDQALYCLADSYDFQSEHFLVSFLGHEAQHFADYRKFPRLPQGELEYRAELTELTFADLTATSLLRNFASLAGSGEPHAEANARIAKVMAKRLFGTGPPNWREASASDIRQAASAEFAVSSRALAKSAWHKLPTVAYKGKQDDIFFVDADHGFYGNGAGKIYATSDGGSAWKQIWDHPGTYVRALGFINPQHGFAGNIGTDYFPGVSDETPLYETKDGGEHWDPVKNAKAKGPCAIDVLHVPFINAGVLGDKVVLHGGGRVGGPAALLTSLDEGATWQTTDLGAQLGMLLDVKFLDRDVGFVCGGSDPEIERSHAVILKTRDGGKNWLKKYESTRAFEDSWKCAFPSDRVGFASVQSYDDKSAERFVVKTTDGGETWQELPLVSDASVHELGIGFVDENLGWVGAIPHAFQTRDGGKTWTVADMGNAVNKIRVINTKDGFVAYAIGQDIYKIDARF